MKNSERELKSAIIKSMKSIKKKYRDLHNQRLKQGEHFREQYKPIIKPLEELITYNQDKNQSASKLIQENFSTPKKIENIITNVNKPPKRTQKRGRPRRLTFSGIDEFNEIYEQKIDDHSVERNVESIPIEDSNAYDKKLKHAQVVLSDIDKSKPQPSAARRNLRSNSTLPKSGEGLDIQSDFMIVNKSNKAPELTYWDDPNELVDRLRLILSSKTAGHSAHDNEIISIVEELREASIIY